MLDLKIKKFEVIQIIRTALDEDLSSYGDITSAFTVPSSVHCSGHIICKEKSGAVLSGADIVCYVFEEIDARVKISMQKTDGEALNCRDIVCKLEGPARSILTGERTALNFLQHMSGIATYTSKLSSVASLHKVKITDTRKTKPGLRKLEKYAVICGGGFNHRFGLFDGILIKDNHIIAAGGIKKAVESARKHAPHNLKIEVEVKNFEELNEALFIGADIIMLDNMDLPDIKKAVEIIRGKPGPCLIEVSGGIGPEALEQICKTGVDIISAGCITHSAPAVDFSLDLNL